MRVLVTGANGFLGHHIVFTLLQRNMEVNILVRSTEKIFFDLTRVKVFQGSFTIQSELEQAAMGCEAVIHAASSTSILDPYDRMYKTNVDSCKILLKVVSKFSISRIVYVSTSNTIGNGSANLPSNETIPISYPFTDSFYARTKLEAENCFVDFAKNSDAHLVIINPTFMIGDFDIKPSSGRLVLNGLKKWVFCPSGGKNFVSVKSVADACVKALEKGISGGRYLISDRNMSFEEFFKMEAALGGYSQIRIRIPDFFMKVLGEIGDILSRFFSHIEFTSRNLNQLRIQEYYFSQKASELEYESYPIEEALKDSIAWFKSKKGNPG